MTVIIVTVHAVKKCMFAVAIKPVLELFRSLGLQQLLLEKIGGRGGDAL
jgi:hypothetical protein